MPPRHAYWTILIDDTPTAFRAREREELQPTFVQLQRKSANVTMQWFARGKLWASREAERDDFQAQKHAASTPRERRPDRAEPSERRGSEWRPGGAHKDPRDRFKKKNRPERAWSEKDPATQRDRDKPGYAAARARETRGDRPWENRPGSDRPSGERPKAAADRPLPPSDLPGDRRRDPSDARGSGASGGRPAKPGSWRDKPPGAPRGDRPWQNKAPGAPRADRPWENKASRAPRGDRPWQNKALGAPRGDRPWQDKASGAPRGDRPWQDKASGAPRSDRPWQDKPRGEGRDRRPSNDKSAAPSSDRPWQTKPTGPRAQRKPWVGKPSGDAPRTDRPWSSRPPGAPPRGDRPWSGKPSAGEKRPWSGKPRDPERKPFTPRGPQSRPEGRAPRKKRDDDPDRG